MHPADNGAMPDDIRTDEPDDLVVSRDGRQAARVPAAFVGRVAHQWHFCNCSHYDGRGGTVSCCPGREKDRDQAASVLVHVVRALQVGQALRWDGRVIARVPRTDSEACAERIQACQPGEMADLDAVHDAIAELIEEAHQNRRTGWEENRGKEYARHWGAVAGWLRRQLPAGHPLAYRTPAAPADDHDDGLSQIRVVFPANLPVEKVAQMIVRELGHGLTDAVALECIRSLRRALDESQATACRWAADAERTT